MKFRCAFLLLCCLALIASCTIEKRHYRNGFYVDWNRSAEQHAVSVARDTAAQTTFPAEISSEENALVAEQPVAIDSAQEVAAFHQQTLADSTSLATAPAHNAIPPDEPKREENDRINPLISSLVGAGLLLELSFILMFVAGTISWMGAFVLTAVISGVVLFLLAMWLRRKYERRIAAGDKDKHIRLSAHFHRFETLLSLYFTAAAIGILGWLLLGGSAYSTGPLSLVGVILTSSGMVLVLGIALVLLCLFFLYLLRWRKDPTGYKPKRDPHPRKDG